MEWSMSEYPVSTSKPTKFVQYSKIKPINHVILGGLDEKTGHLDMKKMCKFGIYATKQGFLHKEDGKMWEKRLAIVLFF